MALFKINKGSEADLPTKITEGYCYVTTDNAKFYVDISNTERICLNAAVADALKLNDNLTFTAELLLSAINEVNNRINKITPRVNEQAVLATDLANFWNFDSTKNLYWISLSGGFINDIFAGSGEGGNVTPFVFFKSGSEDEYNKLALVEFKTEGTNLIMVLYVTEKPTANFTFGILYFGMKTTATASLDLETTIIE